MKAIIISDLHTRDERSFIRPEHFEECDCIILVGDTTASKKYEHSELYTRIDFEFDLPTIGVFGNHENWDIINRKECPMRNVHMKVMRYKGLKFAGIGGVIAKRPRKIYHNDLNIVTDWMDSLIKRQKNIDIFITHEPPLGCFDYIRGKNRGVKPYRDRLEELCPSYIFVGHMHTYRGILNWNAHTTVVNPGVGIRGEYAIFDTDKNKVSFYP